MTKEQALQILQNGLERDIAADDFLKIFEALEIAVECLKSDLSAPDQTEGHRRPLCPQSVKNKSPRRT